MNKSQKIDYDMDFIKQNIAAGAKQPVIIDGLRQAILERVGQSRLDSQKWHDTRHQFYGTHIMNSPDSVFVTLHGTPITAGELNTDGVEPIFQVPDNCMVVMLAPPGTVVFGGDAEDMCSYRYAKTKLFMGAAFTESVHNCYNADRPVQSLQRDDGLVEAYASSKDPKEEEPATIAARVSQRHEKIAEKLAEKEQKQAELKARKAGGCTPETRADIIKEIQQNVHSPYGHEILENMQIFFPGDWVYNQYQEWEHDPQSSGNIWGGYDPNFDIFRLGARVDSYQGTFGGGGLNPQQYPTENPQNCQAGHFPPPGVDLTNLKGKSIPQQTPVSIGINVPAEGGGEELGCIPYNGPTPNMVHPLSDRLKQHYGTAMKITTRELINRLCADGMGPKMIVLNSCSPYRPASARHKGRLPSRNPGSGARDSIPNASNLLLRNYCYDWGRKNLCKMRLWAAQMSSRTATPLPVVPQYDEHRGITVAFTDDREDFYKTIGEFFSTVKQNQSHLAMTPSLFKTFLDLCDKSDKSGKQLATFKRLYNGFLKRLDPRSRTLGGLFFMLPFDQELALIERAKRGEDSSTIESERQRIFASIHSSGAGSKGQGGGKKRKTRKKKKIKRKTRRRRKKRTRRLKKK